MIPTRGVGLWVVAPQPVVAQRDVLAQQAGVRAAAEHLLEDGARSPRCGRSAAAPR